MNRINLALLLVGALTASCTKQPDREALMDEIESRVMLRTDADEFKLYGRNYASHGPEHVRAVYYIPPPALTEDMNCHTGMGYPCSKEDIRRMIEDRVALRARHAAAGQRRWFENEYDLPDSDGGGCSLVHIKYEIATKRIVSFHCNGPL